LFKSTKGKFKLSLNGWLWKSRNVEQKYYWTCEERKQEPYHCKARAITGLIEPSNHSRYINSSKDIEHNHKPKAIRIVVATALSVMKDKAKDHVRTKNCQIIQDTIG
jgi:hypothetical protein